MERTNIPYLSLNPDIEAAIRADRAAGRAHPHRFDDANVVRRMAADIGAMVPAASAFGGFADAHL